MGGNWTMTASDCWSDGLTTSGWHDCTNTTASLSTSGSYNLAALKQAYAKCNISREKNLYVESGPLKITAGKQTIDLPDGAKLIVDDLGNYRIEDKDAKVTYKANRIREFSPHLNASDMVAKFIEYCGALGVRRGELMDLPINLFIQWLIVEAAARDDDALPDDVVPLDKSPRLIALVKPKCLACGRFIPRINMASRFPFCSPEHGARFVQRQIRRIEQRTPGPALAS